MKPRSLLYLLVISAVCSLPLSEAGGELLLGRLIFSDPDVYVMSRSLSLAHWGVELFGVAGSTANGYVVQVTDTGYVLHHRISLFSDPSRCRLVYLDDCFTDAEP